MEAKLSSISKYLLQVENPRFLSFCISSFSPSFSVTSPLNGSENSFLLPKIQNLLISPNQENHVLVENGSLQLLAWTVSGKSYLQKYCQKNISFLSQISEERAQALITNRPSVIGIAGVVGKRLYFIRYPLNIILDFLTACFHECHEYDTIATA